MVYVISKDGKPLMPTKRHGKVRRLLKQGLAKVVRREPFTIQLLYDTTTYVQPVTVGIDIGSKTVGVSAITDKKEVFSAKVVLRTDIKRLIVRKKRIQTVKKVSQDEVQKSKVFE
ncbi:MAG: RRXRR domain-containing protein [Fervidobacterium gondwanense]|uniref:RRXRR protein n=2 Tax=Fervidobacterium gondwanense TaxID=44754 RepID=A0A1M7S1D2_FERGO|nr:RRXRR domain-containing protein [Fervidobacterium gondwanense]SHN52220.1 RRXRR protein [Fervidobacterium gondwanense DSM 13020]